METRVVLDADWFVINGQKYIKKLAYSIVGKPLHGEYELTLPSWVKPYRAVLECQAKHSHHLDWSTTGQYDQEEIQNVFEEIETIVSEAVVLFHTGQRERKSVDCWNATSDLLLTWNNLDVQSTLAS